MSGRTWFWFLFLNYLWYHDRKNDNRPEYSWVNRWDHTYIGLGEGQRHFAGVPLVWTGRGAIAPFQRVDIRSVPSLINQDRARMKLRTSPLLWLNSNTPKRPSIGPPPKVTPTDKSASSPNGFKATVAQQYMEQSSALCFLAPMHCNVGTHAWAR